MKKKLFFLSCLCMILLLGQGCAGEETSITNPPTEEPSITIEAGDVLPTFNASGGMNILTFTATADWHITIDALASNWLSISKISGTAGTYKINITAEENESYDERNALVSIICSNTKQTFTVTQKQKDALITSSNKVELGSEAKDFTIEVQSNINFDYEIEEDAQTWLTSVSTSRGLTTSTLTFHADANTEGKIRQGTIVFSGENDLTEKVTVYQTGNESVLQLSQSEYIVDSEGETIKVELLSNTYYEIEMPEVDWVTESESRNVSTYTHYFTIAPNDTYDARNTEIVFIDRENDLKQTVSITQMQQDAIIAAQRVYEIGAEGGYLDFTVLTNVDFETIISENWITQTSRQSRGLTEKGLHFAISPNPEAEAREATITLQKGKTTQNITVKQSGKTEDIQPYLELSVYDYTADSNGESLNVTVQSNVDYQVTIPNSNWIIYNGKNGNVHNFQILSNNTFDARTADILFTNEIYGISQKLTITQAQVDNYFIVPENRYEIEDKGGNFSISVETNMTFTVDVNANWLRMTEGNTVPGINALVFEVDKNNTTETRTATIILTAANGIQETVSVIQNGADAPYLTIISAPESLDANQQVFIIQTKSNKENFDISLKDNEWLALKYSEWIQNPDKTISFTYTFTVTENTSYNARKNEITISNSTYGISKSIVIEQKGQKEPGGTTGTGNEGYDSEQGNWETI